MDSMRYLKLTDYDNRGKIVKQMGREFSVYQDGAWKRIGMMPYFYPDAPEFECYEVISENEAQKLITTM